MNAEEQTKVLKAATISISTFITTIITVVILSRVLGVSHGVVDFLTFIVVLNLVLSHMFYPITMTQPFRKQVRKAVFVSVIATSLGFFLHFFFLVKIM